MNHCFRPEGAFLIALGIAILIQEGPSKAEPIAPPPTAHLAPHRAVYDLTLDRSGAGSNISDIRGKLTYDFMGSQCEGYTLKTQLITEIFDRDGKTNTTDIRAENQEDAAGKHFRFTTSQYVNDKVSESTKGVANRSPHARDTVTVDLEKPKRAMLTLSGNIYFPTQHSFTILEAALRGMNRIQADIYDGSEKGTKVYETTTVIGPPLELAANSQLPPVKNSEVLDGMQSWPVVVSYYDRGPSDEGLPAYEVSFRMYANGVSRKLKLDYGTFSLDGELSAIEFLKAKPCP